MQNWLISANSKMYRHSDAFDKWGYIDWRQNRNYSVGDTVFIYCTKPVKKIVYKTVIEKVNMKFSEITDDKEFWLDADEYYKSQGGYYARMRLIDEADSEFLSLHELQERKLLKNGPQGPMKMSDELAEYVNNIMSSDYSQALFPSEDVSDSFTEGSVTSVLVNKYERNRIARQKCIEHYGNEYRCIVCGMNFREKYGEVGKQFIHVHHLVPLNEIGEEYVINPEKDLIPVCPNCHAMLHRKINGRCLSPEELKSFLSR